MSISLNNHENRIKALENKTSSSEYVETTLFNTKTDISDGQTKTFNLSNSIRSSAILMIYQNCGSYGNRCSFVPVSILNSGSEIDIFSGGDGASTLCRKLYLKRLNDTSLSIRAYDTFATIYKILGLKLYYNFSYNIYCLIYAFLEFLFKEV